MYIIVNTVRLVSKFIVSIKIQRKYTVKMAKNEDNRLETFRCVCDEIGEESSYIKKAKILEDFFRKGSDKKSFKGDTLLWLQMLIPKATQRVYNLQNKQMLKLFSRLFACDQQDMHLDLEQEGDVSETLCKFFESSEKLKPKSKSVLYLQDVEEFLTKLETRTKEEEQTELLKELCKQATALDLKMIIRLIKQDLRINAGARHILDGLGPLAYPAYQSSRDLAAVVKQFAGKKAASGSPEAAKATKKKASKVSNVQVMTPISPMLANACKSVEEAFKKSSTGLFSEIKYDGERVQIHKQGTQFKFFSRNLKPVMEHKIKRFKEFIPKAFPSGGDMILDSEIILTDTRTGELLPFGSLGAHKKKEFVHAEVCLFVFDCILYDGEDLTNVTFRERRQILEDNITPIKSYVQLSESHFLKTKNELSLMTAKVLKANLEGVVLKNPTGTYQPGKRGWLKVKKDYLFGGKMADTADLVVLGAWFGSGKKGGILSIFLMGCYDRRDHLWKTVTKVHSGLDDATNDEIHEKLMTLMDRADNRVPNWLLCKNALVPDYLAKTADKMPVWEITGAEFTKSEAHTASGISIRFPRITKLRDDKSAEHANDLEYLEQMYEASKKDVNVDLLMADCAGEDMDEDAMEIDSKLNLNFFSPTKGVKVDPDSKPLKRSLDADTTPGSENSKKKFKGEEKKTGAKQQTLNFASPKNAKPKESESDKEPQEKLKGGEKKKQVKASQKHTIANFFSPKNIKTKVSENGTDKDPEEKSSEATKIKEEESKEETKIKEEKEMKVEKISPKQQKISFTSKKIIKAEESEPDTDPEDHLKVNGTKIDEKISIKKEPTSTSPSKPTTPKSKETSPSKATTPKSKETSPSKPTTPKSKETSPSKATTPKSKETSSKPTTPKSTVTSPSKATTPKSKETSLSKPTTPKSKVSNIFENIIAYFAGDIQDKNHMRTFERNGGTLTKNGKKATVVFYESTDADVDLAEFRDKYKRSCRHLSVDWLSDSLAATECQPYPMYAVILK